jgi:hypothetical protein
MDKRESDLERIDELLRRERLRDESMFQLLNRDGIDCRRREPARPKASGTKYPRPNSHL